MVESARGIRYRQILTVARYDTSFPAGVSLDRFQRIPGPLVQLSSSFYLNGIYPLLLPLCEPSTSHPYAADRLVLFAKKVVLLV